MFGVGVGKVDEGLELDHLLVVGKQSEGEADKRERCEEHDVREPKPAATAAAERRAEEEGPVDEDDCRRRRDGTTDRGAD